MAFAGVPDRNAVRAALFETLRANRMTDGVHVRLTLSRGEKVTSGMSPEWNRSGCILIVLAEWKPPAHDPGGVRLITSSVRRNSPQCIDSRIHHANLVNNILAKIEANHAGADDALMPDLAGFVAETNATNAFLVRDGAPFTPHAHSCLPGVTRAVTIEAAREDGVPVFEKNLTLTEAHVADEMFTTGAMGGISPVLEVDGRRVGDGVTGPITLRLKDLLLGRAFRDGTPVD